MVKKILLSLICIVVIVSCTPPGGWTANSYVECLVNNDGNWLYPYSPTGIGAITSSEPEFSGATQISFSAMIKEQQAIENYDLNSLIMVTGQELFQNFK